MSEPTARCRYCIAAWGNIFGEVGCEHDDRHVEVARQIAGLIHETRTPTDQQVGWFLEDAETICAFVPDDHPVVRWLARTMRMVVNGHRFRVADEGGELMYVGGPK